MASLNASRYLEKIHDALRRDGLGDIQSRAKLTIGPVSGYASSPSDVGHKAQVNAQVEAQIRRLVSAAEESFQRGHHLEARLLVNQAEYENAAADLRKLDFGAEYEAKLEFLTHLRDQARDMDQELYAREQSTRSDWNADRIKEEAAQDEEDAAKRLMATENSSDYRLDSVKGRLEYMRGVNPDLDLDTTEYIETRLQRDDGDSLQSNYARNSLLNSERQSVKEYADSLVQEAANVTNPHVKERYERQARFELASANERTGDAPSAEMSRLQVEQAQSDIASSSWRKKSAETRLANNQDNLADKQPDLKDSRQVNNGALTSMSTAPDQHVLKAHDIPGYEGSMTEDQKAISYKNISTGALAFRDDGQKVRMDPASRKGTTPDADIRGALQLSSERFDKFSISGSQEYRKKVAKIAGEMGFADRIGNPDLKVIAEKEAERLKSVDLDGSFQDASLKQNNAEAQQLESAAQQDMASSQGKTLTAPSQADTQASEKLADAATQQKGARAEDAAEELPLPKRSATAQAVTDSNELPLTRMRGGSARPEVETATSTATSQEELPSPRSSNARQTLQGLDSQQAASDDLPQARSDDAFAEEATQTASSMSRSR